ncbi:MAG: DinB family protein [Planctomycetota bacterium]|nr:DinB family protein [Planctomycetota bacterium]
MPIAASFLPEFDHENAATRRLLERVPQAHLEWKPHAKSATLAWLAGHLAQVPTWLAAALDQDVFDVEPGGRPYVPPPLPTTTGEILARFDEHAAAGRAKLAAASDERMLGTWTMQKNGRTMFAMPRVAVVRSFILNHAIHHRGQLTVYLRLLDVPLPSLYGPTADEAMQVG